jgi:hypothetical protein
LFDAKEKEKADLKILPYDVCNFVLSTSPRRDLVNDYKKPSPLPLVFYMPPWSEEEIQAIAPLFPASIIAWFDRFEILGGVPRSVFEEVTSEPRAILDAACAQYSLEHYTRIVDVDSIITEHSKVIHSLVHITSSAPFTKFSVRFSSQTAVEIIIRKHKDDAKLNLAKLLSSYIRTPLIDALCGYLFEPYALKKLEEGGPFIYRSLDKKSNEKDMNTMKLPEEMTLQIPPSTTRVIAETVTGRSDYQSASCTESQELSSFRCLDSWNWRIPKYHWKDPHIE